MTRQDERMRLKKRLFEQAIQHATANQWDDAIQANEQLLQLGEDADCYNRIGKAAFELGDYEAAQDAYSSALRINPSNVIARKNLGRLRDLFNIGDGVARRATRTYADPQLFMIETGKTALTTLTNVPGKEVALRLVSGEQVELAPHGDNGIVVLDSEQQTIGQLEPLLAQRLIELMDGGNRYAAAIANLDGHQIKVLIREIFVSPEQRNKVSFPGKLGGDIAHFRTFIRDLPTRYELDDDALLEDEELAEDEVSVEADDDFFRGTTGEEEEVSLQDLDPDMGRSDEDEEEES